MIEIMKNDLEGKCIKVNSDNIHYLLSYHMPCAYIVDKFNYKYYVYKFSDITIITGKRISRLFPCIDVDYSICEKYEKRAKICYNNIFKLNTILTKYEIEKLLYEFIDEVLYIYFEEV